MYDIFSAEFEPENNTANLSKETKKEKQKEPNGKEKDNILQTELTNEMQVILSSEYLTKYHSACCAQGIDKHIASKWITNSLLGELKKGGIKYAENPVSPENMCMLIKMIENNEIAASAGKKILKEMVCTGKDPVYIMKRLNLGRIRNKEELESLVDNIILGAPDLVEKAKNSNIEVINYFVGEGMKLSKGKADPALLKEIFFDRLGQEADASNFIGKK